MLQWPLDGQGALHIYMQYSKPKQTNEQGIICKQDTQQHISNNIHRNLFCTHIQQV